MNYYFNCYQFRDGQVLGDSGRGGQEYLRHGVHQEHAVSEAAERREQPVLHHAEDHACKSNQCHKYIS